VRRLLAAAAALAAAALPAPAIAIDRTAVVDATAPSYEEHVWTCSADNHDGPTCDAGYVSDFEAGETYTGLPYDWGGYVTVAQFDVDLADGLGAGSHSDDGISDCNTGVDCSGYVSMLWECGHHTTSSIPDIADVVDTRDMWPADVYNDAGSHVIMWVDKDAGGSAVITESSGTCDGVCRRAVDWSTFDGYTPRAAPPSAVTTPTVGANAGTADDPIPIAALPFRDYRNTRGAESDVFDSYACAADVDESGPEHIYEIDLPAPGTLVAHVLDAPAADIDLQLLSALAADACLGRANVDLVVELDAAGTYWLTADSWVGADATEYAGAYVLDVDFLADGGADAGADADAGDDSGADSDSDSDSDADLAAGPGDAGCGCAAAGATGTFGLLSALL
jgi:hypothetical protein